MSKIRRELLPVITFARIDVKRLFRDKVAIFFVFLFPLIFLAIFGSIFGSDNSVSFRLALINESNTAFSEKFVSQVKENKAFDIDEQVTSMDKAKEKMNRGQIDATLVLPKEFGEIKNGQYPSGQAKVYYDQNSEQAGQTLTSVLSSLFDDINEKLVPHDEPFSVQGESTATKGLSRFDYTFAGILGFTLLSLGIFGPTTVFPRLKEKGVLRRYHTTTLKVWQYFVGNVMSNAFVGILAVTLMFISAVVLFDLNMRGNYLMLGFVTVLGTVMLYGIGLALGGWAKNENQAAPLAQLITLPMMFLSGVFFPTFLMPDILQHITQFIPLTAVVDASRLVITENAGFAELAPQLAVMTGWLVAVYAIAFRVFRWE